MALDFDGSTQDAFISSTPITNEPFSVSLWFNSDSATASQFAFTIGRGGNGCWFIEAQGNVAGDPICAAKQNTSGTIGRASTSTGYTVGRWHHAFGVFVSDTSRLCYIDGGSSGSNTSNLADAAVDRMAVASFRGSTPSAFFNGRIEWVTLWNIDLPQNVAVALANGVNPWRIFPQNIVACWPLWGVHTVVKDITSGRRDLTLVNAPAKANGAPVEPFTSALVGLGMPIIVDAGGQVFTVEPADTALQADLFNKVGHYLIADTQNQTDADVEQVIVNIFGAIDTEHVNDLFIKAIHKLIAESQYPIVDEIDAEAIRAIIQLLLNDNLHVADEFLKACAMGHDDDQAHVDAFVKALHAIKAESQSPISDAAALSLLRLLLVQDSVDVADALVRALRAMRDDAVITEDAFIKVLHVVKADDLTVADLFLKVLAALKSDTVVPSDTFNRAQHMQAGDEQQQSDAFVKAVHKVIAEAQFPITDDIVTQTIGQLLLLLDDTVLTTDALVKTLHAIKSENQDGADLIAKILNILKSDTANVADEFTRHQHAGMSDAQGHADAFTKLLHKIATEEQFPISDDIITAIVGRLLLLIDDALAVADTYTKTQHAQMGETSESSDLLVKALQKIIAENQNPISDITTITRSIALLIADAIDESEEIRKELRRIVTEGQDSVLDDVLTQVLGLLLLVINEALQVSDAVVKQIHNVTDDTGYVIEDAAAIQRLVQLLALENQSILDDFRKVAALVFGDNESANEALVKALLKVIADGPVNITDEITAALISAIPIRFIEAMLTGVNDPQQKASGIGRLNLTTTGVNDQQTKTSGIGKEPRLATGVKELIEIATRIRGTRK